MEIRGLPLAENGVVFRYNHLRGGDYRDEFSKWPPRVLYPPLVLLQMALKSHV